VRCMDDNVLVKQLLGTEGHGRVLVVDGGGSLTTALLGDKMAGMGCKNGWAGIVINGAVRDTVALATIAFGVKALGSNPRKSGKVGTGQIDVAVQFGTVKFTSGQWVYCDEDGIVVADQQLPLET
jgi:regulator of ribonuclease activity A